MNLKNYYYYFQSALTPRICDDILEYGKKDPTIVNGGIINSLSNNNRLGLGDLMVVEADESDGSFVKLPHEMNIITNIDCEHLDHYKNLDNLLKSFKEFILNLPFYGYSIICINSKNFFICLTLSFTSILEPRCGGEIIRQQHLVKSAYVDHLCSERHADSENSSR